MDTEYDFNREKLFGISSFTSFENMKKYILGSLSKESEEAMSKGVCILKIDGECSTIHNEEGGWKFYARRDNYKNNPNDKVVPLPEGKQSDKYDQGGKEHFYQMLYISPDLTTGKGKRKSKVGEGYLFLY